ncbi:pyridoxal phosphate-dependent decarboxylase family protein [Nocardioides lianchengensis]|uniref:L-2,4-diaminobutyrate decarboxylase n=1 Tax=Nocardioides lianchengensis TaxID=1045774 RepID=A0A1G6NIS9_9ACTN|nr:aspartate aminotransferase family protein [Nocardioides lianchengensis]NYG10789.1 L-2,4-diaminobutyrate decarboxylase [Nocardioides lianchengensis]SDC67822.1 L-2,4-diaminobutyrate decarboxylase [Nocardioides lianchengensis]
MSISPAQNRRDDPPPPDLHHLFHPDHLDSYVDTMRLGVDHLADTLRRLGGPATGVQPEQAAKPVADVDLDVPLGDPASALAEMSRVYLDDAIWFHDPAYAAHLNCPVVVPALLAEVFVSAVNSSLDTFDQSVGGTFVERHLIDWTNGRIGFGRGADGIFTSGGTQSNLQGLLLARDHALARTVHGDPSRLRILASADAHFSVQKAARLLGLGDEAVVAVPVGRDRRMSVDALAGALDDLTTYGLSPMAVVATAGTTDFGAIDPLGAIAALVRRHRTWLHVDAAYGGGLLVSPTRRHLLAGIEQADSVTVDYHKTWFQPVSASALLVRDGRHLGHVTWHADYLNPKDPEGIRHPNQVDKSLQTTRRFDALKLWMTLRTMGPDTIGGYVDTVVDLARRAYDALADDPAIERCAEPGLSTLVLRFRPEGMTEDAADRLQPRIRQTVYQRGTAMVAATKVDGRCWLKLTLLNPLATLDDVLAVTGSLGAVGRELMREAA